MFLRLATLDLALVDLAVAAAVVSVVAMAVVLAVVAAVALRETDLLVVMMMNKIYL